MLPNWYKMKPENNKEYNAIQLTERESAKVIVDFMNENCACKAGIFEIPGRKDFHVYYYREDSNSDTGYSIMGEIIYQTDWLFYNEETFFVLQNWIVEELFKKEAI